MRLESLKALRRAIALHCIGLIPTLGEPCLGPCLSIFHPIASCTQCFAVERFDTSRRISMTLTAMYICVCARAHCDDRFQCSTSVVAIGARHQSLTDWLGGGKRDGALPVSPTMPPSPPLRSVHIMAGFVLRRPPSWLDPSAAKAILDPLRFAIVRGSPRPPCTR